MDTARNVSCHEVSFRVRLQEQTTCFVITAPQGKPVKLVGGRLDAKAATNKIQFHPSYPNPRKHLSDQQKRGAGGEQTVLCTVKLQVKIMQQVDTDHQQVTLEGQYERSRASSFCSLRLVSLHQCWSIPECWRQRNW